MIRLVGGPMAGDEDSSKLGLAPPELWPMRCGRANCALAKVVPAAAEECGVDVVHWLTRRHPDLVRHQHPYEHYAVKGNVHLYRPPGHEGGELELEPGQAIMADPIVRLPVVVGR